MNARNIRVVLLLAVALIVGCTHAFSQCPDTCQAEYQQCRANQSSGIHSCAYMCQIEYGMVGCGPGFQASIRSCWEYQVQVNPICVHYPDYCIRRCVESTSWLIGLGEQCYASVAWCDDCYANDQCAQQLLTCNPQCNITDPPGGGGGGGTPGQSESELVNLGEPDSVCREKNGNDGIVGKPINLTNGNMYLQHTDYVGQGLSENLSLVRTYNSQSAQYGMFGLGWSTPFEERLTVTDSLHIAMASADGSTVFYSRSADTDATYFPYMPVSDKSSVDLNADGAYTLYLKSGDKRVFNATGALTSIVDRNENATTLTYGDGSHLTSVTSPTGRTLTINYNDLGKITSIQDALGVVATYTYDSLTGELVRVTYGDDSQYRYSYAVNSGTGRSLLTVVKDALNNVRESHAYDSSGRAVTSEIGNGIEKYTVSYTSATETTVTDALGRVTRTTFDTSKGKNVVTSVTGPYCNQAAATRYKEYDASLNMIKETDPLGYKTHYAYDDDGNVTNLSSPVKNQMASYNEFGGILKAKDSLGAVSNVYDATGNLLSAVDSEDPNTPNAPRTTYTYNPRGLVQTKMDPLGNVTKYYYDASGNLTQVAKMVNGLERVYAEYAYDGRGRVTTAKDSLGNQTQFSYDLRDRLRVTTYPDSSTEQRVYNLAGQLVRIVDPRGQETLYAYDDAGRQIRITDAAGRQFRKTYDAMSNVIAETDAVGRTTQYSYNDMNKVEKKILMGSPDSVLAECGPGWQACTAGLPTLETCQQMCSQAMQQTWECNVNPPACEGAYNNCVDACAGVPAQACYAQYQQCVSLEINYVYDVVGNLIESRDTAGHVTTYKPDAGGRTILSTDPELASAVMGYDEHDNMTKLLDARGSMYEFVYDYHDRLTRQQITRNGEVRAKDCQYDKAGNLWKMWNYDRSLTTYEYDALNRLKQINYPDQTTAAFTYEGLSQMIKTATNGSGTVTFSYDNRGRVSSVTDVWGKQITYQYDANGNRTQTSIGGRTMNYQYDPLNRLLNMYDNVGNRADFVYDVAGRITSRTVNNLLVAAYTYDGLDQLSGINYHVGGGSLGSFQYGYSRDLNISQITDRNGTHSYGYDTKAQLTSAAHSSTPAETYTYDGIGNHLTPNGVTHQYDPNGDLRYRETPSSAPLGTPVEYKYDALGRLVGRISGSQWTRYTYDGDDVVLDEKSDGTQVWYGNGPGIDNKLWYQQTGSTPVFFLKDNLGSTRALVSSSGSIIPGTLIDYDSFGKPSTQTYPTRYQYAGREYDPDTELYYYRARWYDPAARRFISEDPIGLNGGINLYAYVTNNPINGIDPSGLWRDPINNPQLRGFYGAGWTPNQSTFGLVRGSTYHQGLDIFALPGTPAFASIDGTVALAGYSATFGNQIVIKGKINGKDVYLRYAHLGELHVKCGASVREGDLVADTGMTGNADNLPDSMAHLHFEMMKTLNPGKGQDGNRQRYNPGDYMRLMPSSRNEQATQSYFYSYPWVPR